MICSTALAARARAQYSSFNRREYEPSLTVGLMPPELLPADPLDKRKIVLFLMHSRIAGDIDRSEIVLNLVQHVAFGPAQRARDLRIHTQCWLAFALGFGFLG